MAELSRRAFLRKSPVRALAAGLGGSYAAGADRPEPIREFSRGGMLYRRLGHTNLYVSLLSFGSHTNPAFKRQATHGGELNEEGQALRDRRIARAIDLGVNMIDMIDTYENAGQWKPMARLARTRRDKVLVSICRLVRRQLAARARIDRAVSTAQRARAPSHRHTEAERVGFRGHAGQRRGVVFELVAPVPLPGRRRPRVAHGCGFAGRTRRKLRRLVCLARSGAQAHRAPAPPAPLQRPAPRPRRAESEPGTHLPRSHRGLGAG